MNLLRLSSLFLAPVLAAGFALACGEISDPTKGGERTATVSGALSGTSVPPGARVAVVWRKGVGGGVVVGSEADIVGGKFSMNLTTPPDAYFGPMDGDDYDSLNDAPNAVAPEPAPTEGNAGGPSGGSSGVDPGGSTSSSSGGGGSTSSGGAKSAQKIGTRDNVSGGITEPLSIAIAGFIVYVDANGNGKLDLEGEYASSPDTIIGGNKELLLTYLKGGGQLDYEKLRDKSGILPAAGFNLAWDEGRWLPLTLVELKITENAKLARAVCDTDGTNGISGGSGGTEESTPGFDPGGSTSSSSGSSGGASYPAPDDPALTCMDNGHYFLYGTCPPAPVGVCADPYPPPCAKSGHSYANVDCSDTPPPGWPCQITGPSNTSSSGGSTSSSGGCGGSSGSSGSSGSTSSSSGGASDAGPAPDAGGS